MRAGSAGANRQARKPSGVDRAFDVPPSVFAVPVLLMPLLLLLLLLMLFRKIAPSANYLV